MLTQSINQTVCTKALLLTLGAVALGTLAAQFIRPVQRVDAPKPVQDEVIHTVYSVDYLPTCSVPVNLMRPPGIDKCTGQARKPGAASELQSSIPLTFRK